MFKDRIRELLRMIDYEYWGATGSNLIVEDTRLSESLLDVVQLPCSELSNSQDRRIECVMNNDINWMQVSATNIGQVGNTEFLKLSTTEGKDGVDNYICSFSEDGSFYDMHISRGENGEIAEYRMMDLIDGKPVVTEVRYGDSNITVSRNGEGLDESICLDSLGDSSTLSFYKNKELLSSFTIDSDVDLYYGSVISTVDNIIDKCHETIFRKNPRLFKMIVNDFPLLRRLNKQRNDCYDTDLIDAYLREYDMFVYNNISNNTK